MPGLFGISGAAVGSEQLTHSSERIHSLLNVRRAKERFVEDALISPPFLLGYHSVRHFTSQKGIAQSDSLAMAFDGILFEPSPRPNVAQLLSLYRQHGLDFVKRLRGHFAFAVCDHSTGDFYLCTDHAASRPLYYAVQGDALYFAGDYPTLSAILPGPNKTDTQAVTDMLTFGYVLGNKTCRESIQCMPPGSWLCWNANTSKLETKPYFVADNTPLESQNYSEMRDELERLFVQAVKRTLQGTNPIFTLSGGLDSRAILSSALKLGITHPDCLTFGELASSDVKLALRVARETKSQAIAVSLGDGDYLVDTFETASRYNGGMVYYNGSAHMLHALQQVNPDRWDIVQTGMSGDMLMGSFLHAAEIREPVGDVQSISERILAQLGQLTWIERLTTDKVAARQLVHDSVKSSLAELGLESDITMSQALELWNLQNRQQRGMFNGFRMIENFYEYTSPFFDADFYEYSLRIPHRYRLEEAIYIDMLSRLIPRSVWRIPWQKSGRPPSAHRWVNKANKWSLLWIGRAMQVIFPGVARKRSMNPFAIWLRENDRLRQFAVEQLLAWDSVPYPLVQDQVRDFANAIADGRIGMTTRVPTLLFRLLTLSTWGQEHVE